MKRLALVLILAVASASLLSVGSGGYGQPESSRAAAKPDCLKIWKKKKVTKKVKRDGRWKKVTYWKRYWVCDPFEAPGPPRLGVQASEFSFGLSRPEVKEGNLVLQFYNRGEDAHNLRIAFFKSNRTIGAIPDVQSGRTTTATFPLKPATYNLVCTLYGHAARGMRAKLRVLPAGG